MKNFSIVKVCYNTGSFFIHHSITLDSSSLAKWSSLDLLTEEDNDTTSPTVVIDKNGKWQF